jgi:metal-responsive CopG/Arc/MetJ family transcriptional regulator
MHTLEQLQKQQIGLRLPKYLIEELDSFANEYSLNRSELISEAIKAFIDEQKANLIYKSFDNSCKELKKALKDDSSLMSLEDLIDELNDQAS